MKTISNILEKFSGVTPLFPLPDFVFFPQTVQPFHIFEPRYVEMISDIESADSLLTIPLIRGNPELPRPEFHEIGTLGYVNQVSSRDDGTLHILVTGLVKARIDELDSSRTYRRGAITPLVEFAEVTDARSKVKTLLRKFQAILERTDGDHNLRALADNNLPVEMVAHMIIASLPIGATEKQKMLELQSLELRIEILNNFLESGWGAATEFGPFDPIVPSNPLWN